MFSSSPTAHTDVENYKSKDKTSHELCKLVWGWVGEDRVGQEREKREKGVEREHTHTHTHTHTHLTLASPTHHPEKNSKKKNKEQQQQMHPAKFLQHKTN